MTKRDYRLIIAVDVEADDLEEAYAIAYRAMAATGLGWESTDEGYGPDGNAIDEAEMSAARLVFLDKGSS